MYDTICCQPGKLLLTNLKRGDLYDGLTLRLRVNSAKYIAQ